MRHLVLLCFLIPSWSFAQKVDLKDVDAGDDTTTIEISKGKKNANGKQKCDPVWEITEGSADITGEPTVMSKDASASWKKACDDWKKEFRADNKENKVINVSCGTSSCSSDAGGKVCVSKATYKVKTRID